MEAEKRGRFKKWRLKREEIGEMKAEKRGRLGKWRLKREQGWGNGG